MNRILFILGLMCSTVTFSQSTEKYNSEYENFFRAEELYLKEQYGAARREFRNFIDDFNHPNDPMYIKALYYEAMSALELYNNDAVPLLLAFNHEYPESIYKKNIYFRLAKYYYYKKDYEEALVWFNQLSSTDIEQEEIDEFYFKLGYSNFKQENFEEARSAFHEVKDGTSQYAGPAMYYYSHIAYQNKNYEVALTGFLKLTDDPQFAKVVPYYIAQIYYLQGKYEEVTAYAKNIESDGNIVNEKDMNHLIGDAYYRTDKYEEAVPFLEKYDKEAETTRDEDYQLGYAYFKTGKYEQAIRLFDRVKKIEDSLGQVAYYHIGESLLRIGNDVSARSAFEDAAMMPFDPIIQEDALYNYAILSYKLDINPYNEAVEAFEMYLRNFPNSPRKDDVYQYLVNVYMSANNHEKALASLDKIPNKDIRLKTAYQLISFNQGVERFQNSNFTGAIESFKQVDKYPVDAAISAQAVYWIADANYRIPNYNAAIEAYKKYTTLSGNKSDLKAEAHYNIGYAYLQKDQLTKSIESFRVFIQEPAINREKHADALMRIADSYYVLKENEQAVKFYQDVVNLRAGHEDQALYYMGKTFGYMSGKIGEKIKSLNQLISNYRESKYLQPAIYEIAESYMFEGNLDKALENFKKIVFDYPSSQLVVNSKVNIADIYYKKGNYTKSKEEYESILAKYSEDQNICEKAVRGIIDVYKATQQQDKVGTLVAQYPCANFTENEQEDIYYTPAMDAYQDSSFQQSILLFEKYLANFPNGRYSNDVKNYMADANYRLGNLEEAVRIYKETLLGGNTGFTEMAAARVAQYLYNNEKYAEVIPYYERLETITSNPEVKFNAQLGIMRSSFLTEGWNKSAAYADKVLSKPSLNSELSQEAYYAKGIGNYNAKNYDAAKTALVWLIKNTTTVQSAEARFSLADIFFQQNHLEDADKEITGILKQKPAYNYWIAKGLILRSRIYIKQDKLFESEQNLKSVLEHYKVDDDGIMDEANELWNELMQLKEQPKSITPEPNHIIEINDENGEK